jgi:hypothetical protein
LTDKLPIRVPMNNFKLVYIIFCLLISFEENSYSQDTIHCKYEFRIFKKGKLLSDKMKKVRVEGLIFNPEEGKCQKLKDNCVQPDKYCFEYSHLGYHPFYLKIFVNKDSMIILSAISDDSLIFKPGQYYFSPNYINYLNFSPAGKKVTIEPSNPSWNKVLGPPKSPADTTIKYVETYYNKRLVYYDSNRHYRWIYWIDSTFRHYPIDTSIKWLDFDTRKTTINPKDTTVYIIWEYSLNVGRRYGSHWTFHDVRFDDRIRKFYITGQNKKYLIIQRNWKFYKVELDNYFKDGRLTDTLAIGEFRDVQYPGDSINDSFKFELIENKDSSGYYCEELDSNSAMLKLNRENIIRIKYNAKLAEQEKMDIYSQDDLYQHAPHFNTYILGKRTLLDFGDCLLYSLNGKNWRYYSLQDFYDSPGAQEDYSWRDRNIKSLYLLEGKGLLLNIGCCGLFLIKVE